MPIPPLTLGSEKCPKAESVPVHGMECRRRSWPAKEGKLEDRVLCLFRLGNFIGPKETTTVGLASEPSSSGQTKPQFAAFIPSECNPPIQSLRTARSNLQRNLHKLFAPFSGNSNCQKWSFLSRLVCRKGRKRIVPLSQVWRTTSAAFLSSHIATKVQCRRCPESVHSTNATRQPSFGSSDQTISLVCRLTLWGGFGLGRYTLIGTVLEPIAALGYRDYFGVMEQSVEGWHRRQGRR
jgi:hypothetical protein